MFNDNFFRIIYGHQYQYLKLYLIELCPKYHNEEFFQVKLCGSTASSFFFVSAVFQSLLRTVECNIFVGKVFFVCLETVIFNFKSIFSTESVSHLFLLTILIADNHKIFAFKWRKIQYLKQKKVDMTRKPTKLSSWISRSGIMEAGRAQCMVRKGKNAKYSEKTWQTTFSPCRMNPGWMKQN